MQADRTTPAEPAADAAYSALVYKLLVSSETPITAYFTVDGGRAIEFLKRHIAAGTFEQLDNNTERLMLFVLALFSLPDEKGISLLMGLPSRLICSALGIGHSVGLDGLAKLVERKVIEIIGGGENTPPLYHLPIPAESKPRPVKWKRSRKNPEPMLFPITVSDVSAPGGPDTSARPAARQDVSAPGGPDTSARPAARQDVSAPGGPDTSARPAARQDVSAPGGPDTSARPAARQESHTSISNCNATATTAVALQGEESALQMLLDLGFTRFHAEAIAAHENCSVEQIRIAVARHDHAQRGGKVKKTRLAYLRDAIENGYIPLQTPAEAAVSRLPEHVQEEIAASKTEEAIRRAATKPVNDKTDQILARMSDQDVGRVAAQMLECATAEKNETYQVHFTKLVQSPAAQRANPFLRSVVYWMSCGADMLQALQKEIPNFRGAR